jgi:hypothetical protein
MVQRSRHKVIPDTLPPSQPAPIIKAVQTFQQNLISRLEDLSVPPTPEDVICETVAVARMAALSGDLETAVKGFKAVGDLMGLGTPLSASTHNHLHLHQTAANMLDADDGTLSDLIAAAKAKPALAHVPHVRPATNTEPHTVTADALLA